MATEPERAHYRRLRAAHVRRLQELEVQQAELGIRSDPSITTEILEIRDKVRDIDLVLHPPISSEMLSSLSTEDQRLLLLGLMKTKEREDRAAQQYSSRTRWLIFVMTILVICLSNALSTWLMLRAWGI